MVQLDTATVLEIIKMIDFRINAHKEKMREKRWDLEMPAQTELKALSDHLQSFIEGQLDIDDINKWV